ncbi:MAG: discoidin domain-containing protein, partial [Candidatus Omnitrophica bacterium]|nr:discoidin domain-containing protein [Candidatus Omnitrophota bacterium]
IRDRIIPAMKKIDPTRPWECGLNHNIDFKSWHPIDFSEDHPYIYSMGPVLNKDDFGYTRSLDEVENSSEPTILNEFVWFWLDKNGNPSTLMGHVLLRWLGKNSTKEERFEYQAQLASDLCELFRRMDVDGIVPFVYLSSEAGCTSNWFTGDIANPGLKPIMDALKNVFSPFGVSIELWDRHFLPSEKRIINVYLFNDTYQPKSGTLDCRITGKDSSDVFFEKSLKVTVPALGRQIKEIEWVMPKKIGTYYLKAELREKSEIVAVSKKIAHIFEPVMPENLKRCKIMVYDPDSEIFDYLKSVKLKVKKYKSSKLSGEDVLILGEGALLDRAYAGRMQEIDSFVKKGGVLIVIEPSCGIMGYTKKEYPFLPGLTIAMNMRKDTEEGGYDSYCFGEDMSFSLWNNIDREHLKMFNGGWGGEMISQCDVELMCPKLVLAKSGLNLKYSNVFETIRGNGVIVVSRIQIRGRLSDKAVKESGLYSRRVDPVARQYLLNLLSTYSDVNGCLERIGGVLPTHIKKITASSIQDNNMEVSADKAADGNTSTRWSSQQSKDPQWIMLDFEERKSFKKVILNWENAYAVDYEIQISNDAQNWKTIHAELRGNGGKDIINVGSQKARYLRIFGKKRSNKDWGYSLWEIGVH